MNITDKVIIALEGGYNLDSLKRCSESIIKTLLGYDKPFKGLLKHNPNFYLNNLVEVNE